MQPPRRVPTVVAAALALAALAAHLGAATAAAQPDHRARDHGVARGTPPVDSTVRVVPRRALGEADDYIVGRIGTTALLLRGDRLLVQLTDAGLHEVGRAAREGARDAEEGLGARLIGRFVGGMVRSLLDHALAYDLRDLGDARYVDDRLVLTRRSGERLFDDVRVDDVQLLAGFEPAEARAFAARLRRAAGEAAAAHGRQRAAR